MSKKQPPHTTIWSSLALFQHKYLFVKPRSREWATRAEAPFPIFCGRSWPPLIMRIWISTLGAPFWRIEPFISKSGTLYILHLVLFVFQLL